MQKFGFAKMIRACLLLILYASKTVPAQEITGWNVKLRITRWNNTDAGKDNIQYGTNNQQYGHNNIQYGSYNIQYGNNNIQYGLSNNIQSGHNNIQYGSNNIEYGNNNIQYGLSNNIQYGEHNIQYGTDNKQSGANNIQYDGYHNKQVGNNNIQYGTYNIQCGGHNIQHGTNHFQDGQNEIQNANDDNKVAPNNCAGELNRRKRAISSTAFNRFNVSDFNEILEKGVAYALNNIPDGYSNILRLPVAEDIYFSKGFNDSLNDAVYFRVERNDRTKAEDNFKDVRLITLTSSSPLQYNSGDTFMIRPRNCQNVVDNLFRMFNKHGIDIKPGYEVLIEEMPRSTPVPSFLQTPVSVHRIAEQYWDLTAYPTQDVFALLAQIAEDELEKDKCIKLSSPEGQADYLNNYSQITMLEVLNDFPKTTSKLTISNLFELFSTIKPQSFSIVSNNLRSPNSLDLLVAEHAEVENSTNLQTPRQGLCPNWLAGLRRKDGVYGWINKGSLVVPR